MIIKFEMNVTQNTIRVHVDGRELFTIPKATKKNIRWDVKVTMWDLIKRVFRWSK